MIHGCLCAVLFMRRARNLHAHVGPPSTCADKTIVALFAASPFGDVVFASRGIPSVRVTCDKVFGVMWSRPLICLFFCSRHFTMKLSSPQENSAGLCPSFPRLKVIFPLLFKASMQIWGEEGLKAKPVKFCCEHV